MNDMNAVSVRPGDQVSVLINESSDMKRIKDGTET